MHLIVPLTIFASEYESQIDGIVEEFSRLGATVVQVNTVEDALWRGEVGPDVEFIFSVNGGEISHDSRSPSGDLKRSTDRA